jgi:hypothetical protein
VMTKAMGNPARLSIEQLSRAVSRTFVVRSPSASFARRADKILRAHDSLGGISRLTFQMNIADLPHAKMWRPIELLGTRVAPLVQKELGVAQTRERATPRER